MIRKLSWNLELAFEIEFSWPKYQFSKRSVCPEDEKISFQKVQLSRRSLFKSSDVKKIRCPTIPMYVQKIIYLEFRYQKFKCQRVRWSKISVVKTSIVQKISSQKTNFLEFNCQKFICPALNKIVLKLKCVYDIVNLALWCCE